MKTKITNIAKLCTWLPEENTLISKEFSDFIHREIPGLYKLSTTYPHK